MGFKYLKDAVTLKLDTDKCIGCGMCEIVCPHSVFLIKNNIAVLTDRDKCMECGACSMNCPVSAITVRKGVGCAYAVLMGMFKEDGCGGGPSCGGSGCC
ncbi:MAG: mercury methylation ferredoxin HgcB [Synergistaceae bacterium]|nr:mercury methylation ferredoxin HgcB [Synergistaceae bacterium]